MELFLQQWFIACCPLFIAYQQSGVGITQITQGHHKWKQGLEKIVIIIKIIINRNNYNNKTNNDDDDDDDDDV